MAVPRFGLALGAFAFALTSIARATPLASGTFALQSGKPAITARFSAVPAGSDASSYTFDIVQRRIGAKTPLRAYEIDYDKLLHLVVIGSDFKTFAHLHPPLLANGHFRGTFALPRAASYLAYVDSHPQRLGQQVFRFAFDANGASAPAPHLGAPTRVAMAGPYRVTLDRDTLVAGRENVVRVHLARGAKPARDLHGYLGGAAHAVFINEKTLSYAHVHPEIGDAPEAAMAMDANGAMKMPAEKPIADTASVPPDYALHVGAQTAGRYKLWLQFRGGRDLEVAPFVIDVR